MEVYVYKYACTFVELMKQVPGPAKVCVCLWLRMKLRALYTEVLYH